MFTVIVAAPLVTLAVRVRRNRWLLVLAVAALPAAVWFAVDMVAAAREARFPVDRTIGIDHWPMQAALALSVPAVVAVAALGRSGGRVSSWTDAVAASWFGTLSVLFPMHAGSLGAGLGAAAICWGALVVVVGEVGDRAQRGETLRDLLGKVFEIPVW